MESGRGMNNDSRNLHGFFFEVRTVTVSSLSTVHDMACKEGTSKAGTVSPELKNHEKGSEN